MILYRVFKFKNNKLKLKNKNRKNKNEYAGKIGRYNSLYKKF